MNNYYMERKLWNEKIEMLSEDEMRIVQWKKLKKQLQYDYDKSPYYKEKFKEVGLTPRDVRSFEDFQQIPIMTKNEHRKSPWSDSVTPMA
jgi:phenylacetate-CoA ligase